MFNSIDVLDCISLLLGAALAYLITAGLTQRRPDLPAPTGPLLFIGMGLILAYGASEVLHMAKVAIH